MTLGKTAVRWGRRCRLAIALACALVGTGCASAIAIRVPRAGPAVACVKPAPQRDVLVGVALSGGGNGRHFYVRQLRAMKISAEIETMDEYILRRYAGVCGWALARAHARSGAAVMIAGYMGSGRTFDEAICDFGGDYADQAERDHEAFVKAFREGRVKAHVES